MPPIARYSKEEIVKAAIAVVEKGGIQSLTARRVAKKLGSSTAPVYQLFSSMAELELAVMKETQKMMFEYANREYTDRVFLNMGTGMAMFACEHGQLYKALLLESNAYKEIVDEYFIKLEEVLTTDPRFTELSKKERRGLLQKMWTFTHGFASLICVGLIEKCDQSFIIETLFDMGSDVIGATLAKSHKK